MASFNWNRPLTECALGESMSKAHIRADMERAQTVLLCGVIQGASLAGVLGCGSQTIICIYTTSVINIKQGVQFKMLQDISTKYIMRNHQSNVRDCYTVSGVPAAGLATRATKGLVQELSFNFSLNWKLIDGLVQERCNSSALAMELHLSCTNPS